MADIADLENGGKRPVNAVVRRTGITAAVAFGAVLGLAVLAPAAPAHASTGGCWNGQCDVYFSQAETRALAEDPNWIPPLPEGMDPSLEQPYQILVRAHGRMARLYENLGLCSALRMSGQPLVDLGFRLTHCG